MLFYQPDCLPALQKLLNQYYTWDQCARLLRANVSTLRKHAKKAGIVKPRNRLVDDPAVLRRLVDDEHLSQQQIANRLGVSKSCIKERMHEYGIKPYIRPGLSADNLELIRELVADGWKEVEIGALFQMRQPMVSYLLCKNRIAASHGRKYDLAPTNENLL